jgi:hypothetical protein
MPGPLQAKQALSCVDRWLQQPFVTPLNPGEKHWLLLNKLLHDSGTARNLINDAHIAAIAIEHGYTVYSADNDFKRFKGVTHANPLESREVSIYRLCGGPVFLHPYWFFALHSCH